MTNLKDTLVHNLRESIDQQRYLATELKDRLNLLQFVTSAGNAGAMGNAQSRINTVIDCTVRNAQAMKRCAIDLIRECEQNDITCPMLHELLQELGRNNDPPMISDKSRLDQLQTELRSVLKTADRAGPKAADAARAQPTPNEKSKNGNQPITLLCRLAKLFVAITDHRLVSAVLAFFITAAIGFFILRHWNFNIFDLTRGTSTTR
ncbi:MAG: hypothetical protein ABR964_04310 [Tepidisphaeraceae bacterium]|jgi:hypothetical protein